jgi:hypothetical protein
MIRLIAVLLALAVCVVGQSTATADSVIAAKQIEFEKQMARNFQRLLDEADKIKAEIDQFERQATPRRWQQAIDIARRLERLHAMVGTRLEMRSSLSRIIDQMIQEQLHANSSKET